jgi:hypothetical protein
MGNEKTAPHFDWWELAMLATLLINAATFLLRSDIKALVLNGWNWVYFLSFCICVIYLADVYRRVSRSFQIQKVEIVNNMEELNTAARAAQSELNTAVKAHWANIDSAMEGWARALSKSRIPWEKTIEDAIQVRADADTAINRRLDEIEKRLPPVVVG